MTAEMSRVPIADHLFTGGPDTVHLIGSRCRQCAVMTFPMQSACPRCGGADMAEAQYDRIGTLWTFTTQEFAPKSPPYAFTPADDFTPYAVGYVEFAGQGVVEGRIDCDDPSALRIGMPMETGLCEFGDATAGKSWWTYCFRPIDAEVTQ